MTFQTHHLIFDLLVFQPAKSVFEPIKSIKIIVNLINALRVQRAAAAHGIKVTDIQ